MPPYRNSSQYGRGMTGDTTVIGPSRALQQWLGISQQEQNRLRHQQDRYQQTQAAYNQKFAHDNMESAAKFASPLWSEDFNKRGANLINMGSQLVAQGINPYRTNLNPENQQALMGYRGEANTMLNLKSQADDLRKMQINMMNQIAKDPSKYRQSDIDAVRDLDKNYTFDDFVQGKVSMPQIQPKIDFQEAAADAKFSATVTTPVEIQMPDGGVRIETRTRLNTDLANTYIDNAFRPGTAYAKEVEGRLRDNGIDGEFTQLLGTTDKGEVTRYIDDYLRSTDKSNPVIDLMIKGKVPAVDTPEYKKFLNDAVNEQLKAEKILDQSKQEFFTGLQAGVKESDKVSYSYAKANNQRAQARFNTQQQKDRLSMQKTQLQISGLKGENQPEDVYDLTISSEINPDKKFVLAGAKSGSTTSFNFNISPDAYNTTLDSPVADGSQAKGSLIGVGVIAVDKDGRPLPGDIQEHIGKPNVDFKVKGQILTDNRESFLENPEVIAQTLSGESKKFHNTSTKNANRYLEEVTKQHKQKLNNKAPKKTKSDPLGLGL